MIPERKNILRSLPIRYSCRTQIRQVTIAEGIGYGDTPVAAIVNFKDTEEPGAPSRQRLSSLAVRVETQQSLLFYAQRFIEKQYEEVKHEAHLHWWNQWIFRSLKIQSLEPTSDYTTWRDDSLGERNSHWLACAGLLTTEIMGAMLVPQSMSYLGYVPGNIMLFVFFGFALVAGGLVWWLFIFFDSPEYPVRTFADIAELLGGKTWRHVIVFLQVVAMILTSATIIIGAAEGLEIMRDQRVCFCGLVVLLCGVQAVIGHLKQLKQLGNLCVWISVINYICLFAQLGFFKEPNWDNAKAVLGLDRGDVHSYAVAPQDFVSRLVSVTSLSYVFAGLLVFPEILAEMRRPWDFWKSMLLAGVHPGNVSAVRELCVRETGPILKLAGRAGHRQRCRSARLWICHIHHWFRPGHVLRPSVGQSVLQKLPPGHIQEPPAQLGPWNAALVGHGVSGLGRHIPYQCRCSERDGSGSVHVCADDDPTHIHAPVPLQRVDALCEDQRRKHNFL
ncbi:hypothetical protein KL939_004403 [Ogataea angusta]|nr:hypothetical protein KL939_004403 [Ogataea angusta]